MRASRPLVPVALFLVGALPAAIFACNSSSGGLTGGPPGSGNGDGDGSTSADSGTPVTSPSDDAQSSFIVNAAPPDTSLPLNMVDATDTPDGGARVTPGVISCGSQPTCNAFAAVQCCLGEEGGACLSTSVTCPPGSASTTCNESADCVVGNVCCGGVEGLDDAGDFGISAKCATACAPPLPQLCRTNEECPDGGRCRPQTCSDGNQYEFCEIYSSPADASFVFTCTAD